jgi:hypothetical protein
VAAKQYWMFPRPHRRLIRVPQSIAAFAGVAAGEQWTANRTLQMQYEDVLDQRGLKVGGDYTERDRGQGGSGGRTHAALLYSLGLFFVHRADESSREEVHLTLAGEALVKQEPALPILRKQVMAFQFPSPYSRNVRIDRRFQLRPFVLLLRLLRDSRLNGYLTDEEIAACVLTYGERHSEQEADRIAERVLAFRYDGYGSLEEDFVARFKGSGGSVSSVERFVKTTLSDVANTATRWLQYTGYAIDAPVPGEKSERTQSASHLNVEMLPEIDAQVALWSEKPPLRLNEATETPLQRLRAEAAWQRTYGVAEGGMRDSRKITQVQAGSQRTRLNGLVANALLASERTRIVDVSPELEKHLAVQIGVTEKEVRTALRELVPNRKQALDQFLSRYQQMAFSGTEEARDFELATTEVFNDVFKLQAEHVGQTGRVPDVVVTCLDDADPWTGIVDTKAYPAYGLESDHQLRMQTSYVPKYSNVPNHPLAFFMYVAGGLGPSFNANLRKVMDQTKVAGSGVGILAWTELILGYPDSNRSAPDLRQLWSLGREITIHDVDEFLQRPTESAQPVTL